MVYVDIDEETLFDAIQEMDEGRVADLLEERFEKLYAVVDCGDRNGLIDQIKTICEEFDITQEELFDDEDDEDEDEE